MESISVVKNFLIIQILDITEITTNQNPSGHLYIYGPLLQWEPNGFTGHLFKKYS